MKKKAVRKLVLSSDTLRRLDPVTLGGAEGAKEIGVEVKMESVTCASNRPCTGCVPCGPTG